MQRFLAAGDLDANPVIEGGDVVLIPRVRSYVTMNGAVSDPGMKEFVVGDKLSTLIKVSRGLRPDALIDSIEISRFLPDDPSRAVRHYVGLTDDPELHEGDAVHISARSQYHVPKLVSVSGEVRHPGKFAIEPGVTRLTDVLSRAGGILPNGSLDDAVVLRRAGITWESDPEYIMLDRLVGDKANPLTDDQYNYYIARTRQLGRSVMIVNFRSLLQKGDALQDILLRDEDSISVPRSRGFVSVLGNVTNPGNIMYDEHANWSDYIRFAGGYTSSADEGEVRIINSRTSTYIDPRGDNTYKIGPGDTIVVPSEKDTFWKNFESVTAITAQVLTIVAGILLLTRN
jgi:protein involved in polysaccharide export with SLBB domain